MSVRNDGGPAFPPMKNPETHESGMSLRDWFAGQALTGELSAWAGMDTSYSADAVSERAYQMADAMLEARK